MSAEQHVYVPVLPYRASVPRASWALRVVQGIHCVRTSRRSLCRDIRRVLREYQTGTRSSSYSTYPCNLLISLIDLLVPPSSGVNFVVVHSFSAAAAGAIAT